MAESCVVGKILEAANFACIKHKDQRRNDPSQTPYINHPIGVAYILWKEGGITDIATIQVFTNAMIYNWKILFEYPIRDFIGSFNRKKY